MREKKVGTTGVALGERESGLYTYEREFCTGGKGEPAKASPRGHFLRYFPRLTC